MISSSNAYQSGHHHNHMNSGGYADSGDFSASMNGQQQQQQQYQPQPSQPQPPPPPSQQVYQPQPQQQQPQSQPQQPNPYAIEYLNTVKENRSAYGNYLDNTYTYDPHKEKKAHFNVITETDAYNPWGKHSLLLLVSSQIGK